MAARAWLLLGLPLTVALALVLGVGPQLQESVFSVVGGDAPTVYSAAYDDGIVQFPSLGEWLTYGLHWIFVTMALVIVMIALRYDRLRETFVAGILASATVLTAVDAVAEAIAGEFTIRTFMTNVAANALGAPLIGVVLLLLLCAYKFALEACAFLGRSAALVGALVMIGLGGLASTAAYIALHYFYQPLPLHIQATIGRPTSGYFWVKEAQAADKDGAAATAKPFDLFPAEPVNAVVDMLGAEGALKLAWQAPAGTAYDISARLLINCAGVPIEKLKSGRPAVAWSNVKSLAIELDAGVHGVNVASDDRVEIEVESKDVSIYWLQPGGAGAVGVEQYLRPENMVRIGSTATTYVYVEAWRLGGSSKDVLGVERTFHVRLNGKDRTIKIPPPPLKGAERLRCRTLPAAETKLAREGPSVQALSPGASTVGVVFTMKPLVRSVDEAWLSVRGTGGWIKARALQVSDLAGKNLGPLGGLAAEGSVKSLRADGKVMELGAHDGIAASGTLWATYLDTGDLQLEGRARRLWQNTQRLSPTRWERTDTGWQVALVGALATALIGFFKLLSTGEARFRDEDVKSWV